MGELAKQARRSRGSAADSIHDTRVAIKHLRALLWYAKPAFSASRLNDAKSHLRKASHLLSTQRDLVMMKSVLNKISRKIPDDPAPKTSQWISEANGPREISEKKSRRFLHQATSILLLTINQLKKDAKVSSGWPSASKRLGKAFRLTQKSKEKALRSKDPIQLHDWRKKAKRLLYQLQLIQPKPGKRLTRIIKRVDELQDKLGDYHDSVVVQNRLQKNPPRKMPRRLVRRSVKLLEKRKRHLCKKARKIARRIPSK